MDRATAIRARIARARRFGESDQTIAQLRQQYYAARAHEYVRDWLSSDAAPTSAQRRELADLILSGGGA